MRVATNAVPPSRYATFSHSHGGGPEIGDREPAAVFERVQHRRTGDAVDGGSRRVGPNRQRGGERQQQGGVSHHRRIEGVRAGPAECVLADADCDQHADDDDADRNCGRQRECDQRSGNESAAVAQNVHRCNAAEFRDGCFCRHRRHRRDRDVRQRAVSEGGRLYRRTGNQGNEHEGGRLSRRCGTNHASSHERRAATRACRC
jgi:hypothetical protein